MSDSLDTAVSPATLQEQQQHFKGLQGALSRETLQYGQLYGGVLEMVSPP